MKTDRKTIGLLILLLGVVAAVMTWNFVYNDYKARTSELHGRYVTLKGQVEELEQKSLNSAQYEEEMIEMNVEMANLLTDFAVYQLPEDFIKLCIENAESSDRIDYMDATNDAPTLLYTAGQSSSLAPYSLFDQPVQLSFKTTYQGLKDTIAFIQSQLQIKKISSIDVTVDSDGFMTGSLLVDNYYMTGSDIIYQDPQLPNVEYSSDNVFGSLDQLKEEGLSLEEGEDEEGEADEDEDNEEDEED